MTLTLVNISTRAKQITVICVALGMLGSGWALFDNRYAKAGVQKQILDIVKNVQKNQMIIQLREDDREFRQEMREIERLYGTDHNRMPPDKRIRYLDLKEKRRRIEGEIETLR